MEYLGEVSGKAIITGQHTQTREQPELDKIFDVTGKLPALCGFELLSYSPNIDYEHSDEECLKEVRENEGTLEKAMEWAEERRGLVTFTWHWFSPLGGSGKSFYTKMTDFDPEKALEAGTAENAALLYDMDHMAELLKPFRDRRIPVLWRPFHESDGDWFWWGSKSHKAPAVLFRLMFKRYTKLHGLNNLVWVWNSSAPEGYPGDDVVDVISRDVYLPKHAHTDYKKEYCELTRITRTRKPAALAEVGCLPDVEMLAATRIPWCWYMTWSKDFCLGEEWNTFEQLSKTYQSDYSVTLDRLPRLY
jgi:mannan endo-1,4-beta-mannosidase